MMIANIENDKGLKRAYYTLECLQLVIFPYLVSLVSPKFFIFALFAMGIMFVEKSYSPASIFMKRKYGFEVDAFQRAKVLGAFALVMVIVMISLIAIYKHNFA